MRGRDGEQSDGRVLGFWAGLPVVLAEEYKEEKRANGNGYEEDVVGPMHGPLSLFGPQRTRV